VAAAFYRVQETKASRLPRISLTTGISSLSSDVVLLKQRDNPVWGWGGRATVPLYLGGSLQAEVKVRTAEQKEAVADYGRAGANAFAEVENALSAGFALQAREPLLVQAVTENNRALGLAETRYRVGSDDLRAVEQQQLKLFSAKSALLRVQSEQLVQRINLHLALGGNFAT
jgi:outer membrane protein TolC